MPGERKCGLCSACCVHVAVHSLDKPAGTPCQHLVVLNAVGPENSGCCGIYEQRPSECQAYQCAWLDGLLPMSLKPDACGMLFEVSEILWPRPLKIIMGFQHRPGAEERYSGELDRAAKQGIVIGIVKGTIQQIQNGDEVDEPVYYGQPDDLAAFATWMEGCRRGGSITHHFGDGVIEQIVPPETAGTKH